MRYRDAAAFRQALERRLKERAAGAGARLARDRKRVVSIVCWPGSSRSLRIPGYSKGGFALDPRLTDRARMTKDIDLDWHEPGDELLDTLLDAAEHDLGDFFTFRIERAGPPEDRPGGSRRFHVSALKSAKVEIHRINGLCVPDG